MIQLNPFKVAALVFVLCFVGYTYYMTKRVQYLESKTSNLSTELKNANASIKTLQDNLTKVETLQSKQTEHRIEKTTETIYIQDQKDKVNDVVKSPVEASKQINVDFSNIVKGIVESSK